MRTRNNNSSPLSPSNNNNNNNMKQGAQTISIGNKDLMTYIPSPAPAAADNDLFGTKNFESDDDDMYYKSAKPSLLASSILEREESLDDEVFNASLDVFLKDDQVYCDDFMDDTSHHIATAATAPIPKNEGGGESGRKRKSHDLVTELSSLANSSECSAAAPITVSSTAMASSLQQQQQHKQANAALHSILGPQLAFSTQGSLVQLPPHVMYPPHSHQQAAGGDGMAIGLQDPQQQQQQNPLALRISPLTAALFRPAVPSLGPTNNNQAAASSSGGIGNNFLARTGATTTTNNALTPNPFLGFNSMPELGTVLSSQARGPGALLPPAAAAATKPPPSNSVFPSFVPEMRRRGSGQQTITTATGTSTSATSPSSSDAATSTAKKCKQQAAAASSAALPSTINSCSNSNLFSHISEDEHERLNRRSIRNIREQQRSHRIADRISELRSVLQDAGVQLKPDRYSTLAGVVNYIKMLQRRSKKLDDEHKVLLETISGAGEMVNGASGFGPGLHHGGCGGLNGGSGGGSCGGGGGLGPLTAGTTTVQTFDVSGENFSSTSSDSNNNDEEFLVFVQGIDYRFIFSNCGVAMAIASVDGRFVDCNDEWLRLTGYTRKELMGEGSKSCSSSSGRGGGIVAAVSTSTSAASTAAHAPPASVKSSSFPPSEILISRQHLSLFNLLGREDMETVYTAMSRMLRSAPPPSTGTRTTATSSTSSSSDPNASDSFLESSSGNEAASGVEGDNIQWYTVDHWAGRVKHTRRKDHSLQLNISLVRTDDGRPKFFNCALSEAN